MARGLLIPINHSYKRGTGIRQLEERKKKGNVLDTYINYVGNASSGSTDADTRHRGHQISRSHFQSCLVTRVAQASNQRRAGLD